MLANRQIALIEAVQTIQKRDDLNQNRAHHTAENPLTKPNNFKVHRMHVDGDK